MQVKSKTEFGSLSLRVALGFLLTLSSLPAATISLTPSADTSLFANYPENNLGGNTNLVAGSNGSLLASRALIRFELVGRIPRNAIIQSVSLSLQVVIVPGGGGVSSKFDLHRVLLPWTEGTGTGNTGSPANEFEPTWKDRSSAGIPWSSPGGDFSTDYSASVSSSALVAGVGTYVFDSSDNLKADAQQWLTDPGANHGWVLASEYENVAFTAKRFASREDPTRGPVLTVQYAIPEPPSIQLVKTSSQAVKVHFDLLPGQPWALQYTETLTPGSWITLTNISSQSVPSHLAISDILFPGGRRFYRLELSPASTTPD